MMMELTLEQKIIHHLLLKANLGIDIGRHKEQAQGAGHEKWGAVRPP